MAKNTGKKFEDVIRNSSPDYLKITRIPDPPQSFVKSENTKYSKKNPYDFEAFDSIHRVQYSLELKSVSQKYVTYHTCEEDEKEGKAQTYNGIK